MVSPGVVGAAAGTGLALVVAVTIVVYRYYYTLKRREKYAPNSLLERYWPGVEKPFTSSSIICFTKNDDDEIKDSAFPASIVDYRDEDRQICPSPLVRLSGLSEARSDSSPLLRTTSCPPVAAPSNVALLDCWRKPQQMSYYAVHKTREFNMAKEHHAVQPSGATVTGEHGTTTLPHQSRSYPSSSSSTSSNNSGSNFAGSSSGCRVLARNPSISSQSSLEGATAGPPSIHRGSSPQIRAFGPDGRHHYYDLATASQAASSYPPSRSSRSPSPARAASMDARCASPASFTGSIMHSGATASPSQSSLSSLATGASSSCGSSSMGGGRSGIRCLSPLLIPPPSSCLSSSEGGPAPPASPLGSLQPDLYQRRDGPVFLSARRIGKSMGRLHLRLKYDFDRSDLHVHLIEAHDLAGSDQGGFNDPYVKLTLSPEVDTRKRQTPIHRNDPNPFFDQHFKFPVSHEQLQEKILLLQVFDYDRFSRNDVVGSVRVAMEQLELVSSTSSIEVWGEIAREKKPPEEIQQVLLSLSYLPSAERLTVLILKARNLFSSQDKEILDPFVKVSLLSGDKRVKKKKTAVRKATRCPVWNEAMSFNVAAGALASSAIEVCVLDSSSELMGGNAIVGSCIVGPSTGGTISSSSLETDEAGVSPNLSREHWLHMTHSPRKAIAMWHTLH